MKKLFVCFPRCGDIQFCSVSIPDHKNVICLFVLLGWTIPMFFEIKQTHYIISDCVWMLCRRRILYSHPSSPCIACIRSVDWSRPGFRRRSDPRSPDPRWGMSLDTVFRSVVCPAVTSPNMYLQLLKMMENERFACPEVLFNPLLIRKTGNGIHKTLLTNVNKCGIDLRKDLFGNVVLSGAPCP